MKILLRLSVQYDTKSIAVVRLDNDNVGKGTKGCDKKTVTNSNKSVMLLEP